MVIVKVRELSADEKLRRLAFYREKRLHENIEKLLKKVFSKEQIEDILNWFVVSHKFKKNK